MNIWSFPPSLLNPFVILQENRSQWALFSEEVGMASLPPSLPQQLAFVMCQVGVFYWEATHWGQVSERHSDQSETLPQYVFQRQKRKNRCIFDVD